MKRLEDLPQIAEESLAGLKAGPGLRYRILSGETKKKPVLSWRMAAAVAAGVLVLAVGLTFALSGRPDAGMTSFTAGSGRVGNEMASLDRGHSRLSVTRSNGQQKQGIWAGSGMVRVDGRYYRCLQGVSLDEGSVGGVIAVTTEYTQDLSLSTAACSSNLVPAGTEVRGVNGMEKTLVACRVGAELKLFQRVSFSGYALLGSEGFGDVMQLRGHVVAMSLSGVGLVEGDEAANLFATLAGNARYEGAGSVTQQQVLIIELDNGAAVQMDVKGDRLGACGVWSCPEFIEAFGAAMR